MANNYGNNVNLNSFLPVLTIKLDRNNYTFWRFQIQTTVRAHGYEDLLSQFVVPPPQFISTAQHERELNPDFQIWTRRDAFLMSWLVSSISEAMIGHVTRCVTAQDVWLALENLFQSQSKARAMQLKLQLQTQKKGDLSIDDYFLKMRGFADALAAIGKPVADDDLILHILAGFGPEYDAVVVNLTNRADQLSIHEVQYALQAHEVRMLQNHSSFPSANYVQTRGGFSRGGGRPPFNNSRNFGGRGRGQFDGGTGRGFGRGSGGRGSFVKDTKIVCQLCGKPGHVALKCYKRFDVYFTGEDSSSSAATSAPQAFHTDFSFDSAQEEAYYADLEYEQQQWIADSGATAHVTHDVNNLQHGSTSYSGSDMLAVGSSDSQHSDERESGQRTLPA